MRMLKDLSCEIQDTNSFHWGFENFHNDASPIALSIGYNALSSHALKPNSLSSTKWVLFNNWAPCEYAQKPVIENLDALTAEEKFDFVLSICPYTSEWLNENAEVGKHLYCFYPYSDSIIPGYFQKEFDVLYHGGIHGKEHKETLKVMKQFKYAYSSLSYGINKATQRALRGATHIDMCFQEKINLVAKSKISICFNLLHVSGKHLTKFREYSSQFNSGLKLIEDLSRLDFIKNYPWIGVLPQFKTRVHEAAISKTINLVYRDKWNIIEDYYEPESEFIYFSDMEDLKNKIDFILCNWKTKKIQSIVENAYLKSKRYTTQNFVKCYSQILQSPNPINAPKFYQTEFWEDRL